MNCQVEFGIIFSQVIVAKMSGELSNVIENLLLILEMFIFPMLPHSRLSHPANLIMKS